ncbi:MAG: hypothetical protein JWR26_4162 [Pedosphaera sp.]|nr:hypothetical protein [Pedosphaera sp.]
MRDPCASIPFAAERARPRAQQRKTKSQPRNPPPPNPYTCLPHPFTVAVSRAALGFAQRSPCAITPHLSGKHNRSYSSRNRALPHCHSFGEAANLAFVGLFSM